LGKSIHADLDKGAVSLPIIYLAQSLSVRRRNSLLALPLDAERMIRVADEAKTSGAIARAQDQARAFVRRAEDAIEQVPHNGLGSTYHQLAEYAVTRRS
jgi:geranylgeranyl pyrophosphate synthase